MQAFDAIPLEEQADMLADYAKNAGKAEVENEKMIEMYRGQQMDKFTSGTPNRPTRARGRLIVSCCTSATTLWPSAAIA